MTVTRLAPTVIMLVTLTCILVNYAQVTLAGIVHETGEFGLNGQNIIEPTDEVILIPQSLSINSEASVLNANWSGLFYTHGVYDHGYFPQINRLLVFQDKLILGGDFSFADDKHASGAAVWDGTSFNALSPDSSRQWYNLFIVHDGKIILTERITNEVSGI
ncbi:hypothetical protein JYT16_02155, partial [Gemmatimonas aurantiaca]|nr:hypothetical protein [Gemmatimonas aurantiaca]